MLSWCSYKSFWTRALVDLLRNLMGPHHREPSVEELSDITGFQITVRECPLLPQQGATAHSLCTNAVRVQDVVWTLQNLSMVRYYKVCSHPPHRDSSPMFATPVAEWSCGRGNTSCQ